MRHLTTIGVCSLVAASSLGQSTFMTADLQIWEPSSQQWIDNLMAVPGDTVDFRLIVTYGLASGTPAAWGGFTARQISIADWAAGDVLSNLTGKFQPSTQTFGLSGSGTTGKLDRADNPSGSVQFAQLPPNNGGDTANPIQICTFSYTFEPGVWWRHVYFNVPTSDITLATIYTTASGSSTLVPAGGRSFDGATVHLFPSPGAATLLGACGLCNCRRRRA